jgi:hypothetical protein
MVRAEDSFSRFTTDSRCAGPGLFRLGALRPAGWLRRQLEIQAQGLCGHLDEFWPDVRDSGWIGGEAEGWERAPYWLDGLIPLAFLLEDERLIAKVDRWMDHILAAQGEDGWLGPQQQEQQGYHSARDPWPLFVMLKAMTQFAEAREEDASGARCFVAIGKALHAIASLLDKRPLFDWNQYRWADLLLTIRWYLARREDALVAELAERIHHQGYDWETHFARFVWTGKSRHWTFDRHVVNNAMGLKAPGLWQLHTEGRVDAERLFGPIDELDRHHGQPTGMFSGDECLAGRSPSQGTELCAVVEYLFSLEQLSPFIADARLSERFERIAFSALPAPFTADMWAHQYDQQVNQVQCTIEEERVYTTNRADANLYGLEPDFGCCTANMHQGFPKLCSSLWCRGEAGSIRALSYAPCEMELGAEELGVEALRAEELGTRAPADSLSTGGLRVTVTTAYPFDERILIVIEGHGPLAEAQRRLELPIPSWAEGATLALGEQAARPCRAGEIAVLERTWSGRSEITLRLPLHVRAEFAYRDSVSVYCGPVLFAYQPQEEWIHERGEHPHSDWRVLPRSPWNVAIGLKRGAAMGLERSSVEASSFANTGLTEQLDPGPLVALQEGGASLLAPSRSKQHGAGAFVPVELREVPDWGDRAGGCSAAPAKPDLERRPWLRREPFGAPGPVCKHRPAHRRAAVVLERLSGAISPPASRSPAAP